MSKLTPKQEAFCNYYVETGNASEAYRRAYNAEKMKFESVNRKAVELLNNGKITARVKELQRELQIRSDITKDEAIKELSNIVRNRVTNVLSASGGRIRIKNLNDLPDEVVSVIASIKKIKGGIEVKFHDKIAAIDRLSKMLGWDVPSKIKFEDEAFDISKLSPEERALFLKIAENVNDKG